MAGSRTAGALRLLWRHRQQLWLAPLPDPGCQSLARSDKAARTKATNVVGPFQCSLARQPTAAAEARSRLARSSGSIRGYSSEEPDAGKLQVRICGGGGGRPPPLPDRVVPAPTRRSRAERDLPPPRPNGRSWPIAERQVTGGRKVEADFRSRLRAWRLSIFLRSVAAIFHSERRPS
jgi:hypothetical protein